jgi:hypothetical protein
MAEGVGFEPTYPLCQVPMHCLFVKSLPKDFHKLYHKNRVRMGTN